MVVNDKEGKLIEDMRSKFEDFTNYALNLHVIILYLIVMFLIIAGGIAFIDGTYSVLYMIYSFFQQKPVNVTIVIVSAVTSYLLSVVLFVLGYGILKSFQERGGPVGFAAVRSIVDLQNHFIGMIISTIFVVMLQKILESKNVDEVLKLGITIAILAIAAGIYIWCNQKSENTKEKK